MGENTFSNKRIAKNTLFLYVRMFIVLIVSLYTSRVVLNVLGVSDYGVNNVVAGFVTLFSFLNGTLSAAISRYYNYEGGRDGDDGFTRVYSVSIRVQAVLASAVFILLETFGLWYVNNVLVVPTDRIVAANYLFQFSTVSMVLVIMRIPFTSVIVSKERMGFFAIVSIVDTFLHLIIVIALPHISSDKLITYAFLQLCLKVLIFVLDVVYAKIQFNYLKITRFYDKMLLRSMLSFSGWNLFGTFIFMLKGQGVNMLLNAFFGTIINAARGVAFQVNTAIMGFSSNIATSYRPQMVASYASGDTKRSFNLFKSQSKICYCMILMLITPVILEIDNILHIWLGNVVPDNTNIFTALVLIDAMICTLSAPVTQLVYATGKVKKFQICTSAVNFFLIPICWIFLKLGYEAWIVFLITIFVSVVVQVVALIVLHSVFDYKYGEYINDVIVPCVSLTLLVPIIPLIITRIFQPSLIRIIITGSVSLFVMVFLFYYLFSSEGEKEFARGYIKRFVKK